MADYNTSPQMQLPIPVVGIAGGPLWATLLDACLTKLDGHDHTQGNGAPIPSAALNINADISMIGHNLTNIRTLRFAPQTTVADPSDLGALYEIGTDLYYTDGIGQQIRITQSGAVTGATGTITGLPSGTASASYSAINGTFVFESATSTAANLDAGALVLRNTSPNSTFGLTLQPPAGLSSNYGITLPPIPAASNAIVVSDASGTLSTVALAGAQLAISGGFLFVPAGSIDTARMADSAITTAKIADSSVTPSKTALNVVISGSSGTFNQSSTTPNVVVGAAIGGTGRPIEVRFQADGSGNPGVFQTIGSGGTRPTLELNLKRNGTTIATYYVTGTGDGGGGDQGITIPSSSFNFLDTATTGAAAYTYQLIANRLNGSGAGTVAVGHSVLVLREY